MANSCRIFIGGLGDNCSRNELEREFEHIGRMRDVWVARNPPGFGFIIFEDQRDASDAVREMDGRRVCGQRVRVEMARDPNDRSRNPRRNEKCYSCGKVGHISRECRNKEFGGPPRRGRSRSRSTSRTRRRVSRSRSRSVERKRSRSRSRDRRSPSNDRRRSPSQERRRSPERRSRSRSASHHSN